MILNLILFAVLYAQSTNSTNQPNSATTIASQAQTTVGPVATTTITNQVTVSQTASKQSIATSVASLPELTTFTSVSPTSAPSNQATLNPSLTTSKSSGMSTATLAVIIGLSALVLATLAICLFRKFKLAPSNNFRNRLQNRGTDIPMQSFNTEKLKQQPQYAVYTTEVIEQPYFGTHRSGGSDQQTIYENNSYQQDQRQRVNNDYNSSQLGFSQYGYRDYGHQEYDQRGQQQNSRSDYNQAQSYTQENNNTRGYNDQPNQFGQYR